MVKRLIALLLALLLIFPALGEEGTSALYLLVLCDSTGEMQSVGSAVLYRDNTTLLTAAPIPQTEGLYAQGAGGSLAIAAAKALGDGLTLLTLETPSLAAPLAINAEGSPALALGHDTEGGACSSTLDYMTIMPYGSDYALIYTAQQAMLPGSVLLDENGAICGVTLAAYGEGIDRYVAVMDQALAGLEYNVSWVSDFTVAQEQGLLTVDWSACDMTCDQKDCVVSLFVQDLQNPYFTYYIVEEGDQAELLLAPGRSYRLWLQHAHGEAQPDMTFPENPSVLAELPIPETFNLYDYETIAMYLSAVPAAQAEEADNTYLPPMENVNAQTLLDPDNAVFLQVRSTYGVDQQEDALLVIALITPEGYCFCTEGQFLFQPELQQQDDWNVNINGLLEAYVTYGGQLASGEYTIIYYLDGALGAQFAFTLE